MDRGVERQRPSLGLRAGVIPFRSTPGIGTEVLLIRRRGSVLWAVPKGRLMAGHALHMTAAIEADEEVGVRGRVYPSSLGSYLHTKASKEPLADPQIVEVVLFPLQVDAVCGQWPEVSLRERWWVRQSDASALVAPGQLRDILAAFVPYDLLDAATALG